MLKAYARSYSQFEFEKSAAHERKIGSTKFLVSGQHFRHFRRNFVAVQLVTNNKYACAEGFTHPV